MSNRFKIINGHAPYFVTFTIIDWVDIFTRKNYRDLFLEALNFYIDNRGLIVYEYVIMSNHIHTILQQPNGQLGNTVRDLKKYTAKGILAAAENEPESRRYWMMDRFEFCGKQVGQPHQVWVHDSHAVELWSLKFFDQKCLYIQLNPVRAGLVEKPEDWMYSSAYDRLSHSPKVKLFAAI